jgi:nicotinate-nucleotide pyrophosphorylase (carboxylating)
MKIDFDKKLVESIQKNVADALAEDLGTGDLTANLVPQEFLVSAKIITRENAIMAGIPWVDEVYNQLDPRIVLDWQYQDGDRITENTVICKLEGSARSILSGERTALNFLQTLSATATVTAKYVAIISDTKAKILDTRKTIPGLRLAQKYAVRCGGGINHRIGLFDAVLIKENHILSAGNIQNAIRTATKSTPDTVIEVEVESLDQLRDALKNGAKRLLLDNFSLNKLRCAVEINRIEGIPVAELEASGELTLDNIRKVAQTGIDYISVGALTKNIRAINLSMQFD